ncbi:S-adenosylmethionine:tRNA ribosyltransferase-isomerase [hydrothermal vent metagenome]|uniref:S-adenosylmethionine:tRNA ribosyltransferase-isomerase n=1 Tax=hydrothermal vent metagenome TaxID=652676 RepID=A0A3B0VP31_9ZZZZ
MKKSDFHFDLPKELIAQHPTTERTQSRLLVVDKVTGKTQDLHFLDIVGLLNKGDLLVFNNTKVIPARLFGKKNTGGKVEVFIERLLDDNSAIAFLKTSKTPKLGMPIYFGTCFGDMQLKPVARKGMFYLIETQNSSSLTELMDKFGHMPLPPYIHRKDEVQDSERYQTVYAKAKGAVAAPTAGLHFDEKLLQKIANKGVHTAFVTLHVGAGTFQPVKTDWINDHVMHKEWLQVSDEVVKVVKQTKANGNKVIAVGTTAVRCLETASKSGEIKAYTGDTNIFIYPGYQFNVVDSLLTNFHLPESTLIMLVAAKCGIENTLNAYEHAVTEEYRFFSYGDAMFVL